MCFSATASLIAGTALSTVGVESIRTVKKSKYLPFAMIPLLLGIQQLIEGFVWLSFRHNTMTLNAVMTFLYSVFAFVLWPVFVSFAVWFMETSPKRKKLLKLFMLVGLMVGIYLLYNHIRTPVTSAVVHKSIVYTNSHFYGFWVIGLYLLAIIGSCLASTIRMVKIFGALIFVAALIAYWVYAHSFVSVWCFFAAIVSLFLYMYFRKEIRKNQPPSLDIAD
jgi:hypothetical protein